MHVQLLDAENMTVPLTGMAEMPESEMLNITTDSSLQTGINYTLTIHFQGKLRTDGRGLYYFGHVDETNTVRYVLGEFYYMVKSMEN